MVYATHNSGLPVPVPGGEGDAPDVEVQGLRVELLVSGRAGLGLP